MRAFAQKPKAPQQTSAAKSTTPGRAQFRSSRAAIPAAGAIQTKLAIDTPGDEYEQEADRVAEQVMRMPEPQLQRACACGGGCPKCRAKQAGQVLQRVQTRRVQPRDTGAMAAPPIVDEVLAAPGQPLDPATRDFMESRFGHPFGHVRVHADKKASESAHAVGAKAYAVGQNVVFGAGSYAPQTHSGLQLLAHELAHVVQQGGAGTNQEPSHPLSPAGQPHVQRTLGDGHDLTSPRFSRLLDLEEAYDGETVIREGSSGRGVQAIQQVLYDLGYPLPAFGADGNFGAETKIAVQAFQRDHPPLAADGEVGDRTMAALDTRFGTPVLPAAAALSAPWTEACVRSVLCPWSPHTVEVLRTRITLKSFDTMSRADERWDGTAWVPDPFNFAGYQLGTEIGVKNSSCESIASTLYHEVLHAEQPTTHRSIMAEESYAYRITEELSIALNLGGRPGLRSTDPQGREFADQAKIDTHVATRYAGVTAGGGNEEIIGKALAPGYVRVQRASGIYTRPAAVGEKVRGRITTVNPVTHSTAAWIC